MPRENQFSDALRELQIGKLLRCLNVTKNCGIPAFEVYQFLLLLVFQRKNLFRFLNSKHEDQAVSKNTYYRFLNETSYNWKKFLLLLAARVISVFDFYHGKAYTLPELQKFVKNENATSIFGFLVVTVTAKNGIPVTLVFVLNRNKKSECPAPAQHGLQPLQHRDRAGLRKQMVHRMFLQSMQIIGETGH